MKQLLCQLRKRGRAVFCVLLAAVLVVSSWGSGTLAVYASGQERTFDIGIHEKNVTATLNEDGLLTITGAGEIRDYTPDSAPFREYKVTAVEIGRGITSIGDYLFYNCGGITGPLVLPKGLIRIGSGAFSGDTLALAPKPEFVENLFTDALVADKKTEESSQTETSSPSEQEGAAGEETSSAPEQPEESSVSEETQPVTSQSETSQPETSQSETSQSETSQSETDLSIAPEEAAAPEGGAGEVLETSQADFAAGGPGTEEAEADGPESGGESSAQPAESAPAPEGDPEAESGDAEALPPEALPPEETSSEEPSAEKEKQYTVENIKEQEIGAEIFFPRRTRAVFYCSKENESFRSAMREAGYREAASVFSAVFDCGDGTDPLVRDVPVIGGSVILPSQPREFKNPPDSGLYEFVFSGWTEDRDPAGTLRLPGSTCRTAGRTELYFFANWKSQPRVKIAMERRGELAVFSIPDVEGIVVSSYQWQYCSVTPGSDGTLRWKDIPGETESVYTRQLQPGDADLLFRCVVTAKEEPKGMFKIRLFSAEGEEEELELAAVNSGITRRELVLTAVQGSGAAATTPQTVSLPTTEIAEGETETTVYQVTGVTVTGDFTLVQPTESGDTMILPQDQTPGSTFAVRVMPVGAGWEDLSGYQQGGYLLGNSTDASFQKRSASAPHPSTLGDGTPAEIAFTLAYDAGYETLAAGSVEVTLEELAGSEVKNTVIVRLTLEDAGSYQQEAFIAPGRSFVFPDGDAAAIVPKGAVTAGFVTTYYPAAGETATLRLYKNVDGEGPQAQSFPAGTRTVLADMTDPEGIEYYSLPAAEAASALTLPTPAERSGRVEEILLAAVDLSHTAGLADGSYFLVLSHGDRALAGLATAAFTVETPQPQGEPGEETPPYSLTVNAVENAGWTFQIFAGVPDHDSRYDRGKLIRLTLTGPGGAVSFPQGAAVTGSVEHVSFGKDGSLSFVLPSGAPNAAIALDLSQAAELPAGEYTVTGELRPMPGVQVADDAGTADAVSSAATVTVAAQGPTETDSRPMQISLGEGGVRVVNVKTAEEPAKIPLVIEYENAQEGDVLKAVIEIKTGSRPGEDSYIPASGVSVTFTEDALSEVAVSGDGTVTAEVSVPPQQASGTYRVYCWIEDTAQTVNGSHPEVGRQPYNFIVN